ncbi:MAG: hypothetical protein CMK59_09070 [Proteobacteria bacterium]|nr:hypothetical protein [Pseudomonadota bacterium]
MTTATKTVVFTDLANYTQSTAGADREQIRKLIEDHETHTRNLFEPYGGEIIKGLGDAFLTIFDSATAAVRACMDIVETTVAVGDKDLRIRASAATGDVELIKGDCFGEAVNLSARINSKVPAGEAWFANRTRLCMNQKEVPWETVGVYEFKGIPDPVQCFRAVPPSQCILPEAIEKAARSGIIKYIDPSTPPANRYNRDDIIIIRGFDVTSDEFAVMEDNIPVSTQPSQVYLLVTTIPGKERNQWSSKGYGVLVGTQSALADSIQTIRSEIPAASGSQTLFMDLDSGSDLSLDMVGMALRNPFPGIMQSYSYDLLSDGSFGFGSSGVILKVEVSPSGNRLHILSPDVSINGRRIPPGTRETLVAGAIIRTSAGQFRYNAVSDNDYRGIIVGPPTNSHEARIGDAIELGREPAFGGFELKDREGLDRIQWCAGGKAQKAKQMGYTLDRAMIGRKQAILSVNSASEFGLTPIHDRIPTYIYSDERLQRLPPKKNHSLNFGELIVVGTYVLCVNPPVG